MRNFLKFSLEYKWVHILSITRKVRKVKCEMVELELTLVSNMILKIDTRQKGSPWSPTKNNAVVLFKRVMNRFCSSNAVQESDVPCCLGIIRWVTTNSVPASFPPKTPHISVLFKVSSLENCKNTSPSSSGIWTALYRTTFRWKFSIQ